MGAHFERGRVLASLRRYAEAIDAYRQELALDPNCVATHANIAAAQFNLGRVADAEDTIRHSLGIDPSFAHSYYILSMIERRRGRSDAALAASLDAVRLAQQAIFFCELARVHHDAKRPAEALAATASALELQPDHVGSLVLRAEILSSLGRVDEAAEVLKSQIAANAENAEYMASLGKVAFEMRNTAEAIDLLQEGRRLDPVVYQNRDRLAEAYGRQLRPFRALDRFLRSLELWKPLRRWTVVAAIATSLVVVHLLTYPPRGDVLAAIIIYFVVAMNATALICVPHLTDVYPRIIAKLLYRRRLDLRWGEVLGEAVQRGSASFLLVQLPATWVALMAAYHPQFAFWVAGLVVGVEALRGVRRAFPAYGRGGAWMLLVGLMTMVALGIDLMPEHRLAALAYWAAYLAVAFGCRVLIRRMELRGIPPTTPQTPVVP